MDEIDQDQMENGDVEDTSLETQVKSLQYRLKRLEDKFSFNAKGSDDDFSSDDNDDPGKIQPGSSMN